jgi:hypothetical protein
MCHLQLTGLGQENNFIYMKKFLIIILLLGLTACSLPNPPFGAEISENLKLETTKDKIIDSQIFTEDGKEVVAYSYKSDEIAPVLDNEIIEKRTENIVTRNLGGNKRSAQSGYNFYKENGEWKKIKFATTTKEVFDKETLSGWIKKVLAADTGAKSPGTMADDATIGTKTWSNPDNAKVSDNVDAELNLGLDQVDVKTYNIRLIIGGVISGDNKATGNVLSGIEAYVSYGGATILWGLTPTVDNINASNFGIVYSVSNGGVSIISHYLNATNFGFAVPAGSTINGILAEFEEQRTGTGRIAYIDHIRITVYYTEGAGAETINRPDVIWFD